MPEPITLGYLSSFYARAADTFVRREVEQLRRLGHVVHTFSIRKADPRELVGDSVHEEHARTEFLLEAGLGRLALAGVRTALSSPRKFLGAVQLLVRTVPRGTEKRWVRRPIYLLEAAYLAERLQARGVRHLHNHIGENSAVVAMLAAMFQGIPYSLTIHGPGEFERAPLLALNEKVHRAAFIVAISHFTRSQLYRWVAVPDWPKIHVVHCGVDEAFSRVEPVPVPSRARLVSVGRLAEQKGHVLLVEASALLRDRGLDFELAIVGDGPMRRAVEQRIGRLGLQDQVRVTGYVSNHEVRQELLAARALVLPSFAEGLPGVIIEAFALGRPVISTWIAGVPELVQAGVNGWLVPAGSSELLADAMAEVLTADPARLEQMGRAGAVRVAQQHNAPIEARKLEALFLGRTSVAAANGQVPAEPDILPA